MPSKPQYGQKHQAEREAWRPVVEAGRAYCAELVCLEVDRWIPPYSEWDMAHDRRRPGEYLGPAHPRCNRSEGGKAAHAVTTVVWEL